MVEIEDPNKLDIWNRELHNLVSMMNASYSVLMADLVKKIHLILLVKYTKRTRLQRKNTLFF